MTAPLTSEQREAIRRRARVLRRRRLAALAALPLSVAVVAAVVATRLTDGPHRAVVYTGTPDPASCPAAGLQITRRSGQNVTFGELPQGWIVHSGNPANLDLGVSYGPAVDPRPASVPSGATYTAPSLSLTLAPQGVPHDPEPVTPPTMRGGPTTTTTTVTIGAVQGTENIILPGGQPASPASPEEVAIGWTPPGGGSSLQLTAIGLPPEEVLGVARAVHYSPGTMVTLPARPVAAVPSATAVRALPVADRRSAHHALSTLAEVVHLANGGASNIQAAPYGGDTDYRAVWLVWAPTTNGEIDWAAVDTATGTTLDHGSTALIWPSAITDRSQPGCEPPAGLLTRSEVSARVPLGLAGNPTTFALVERSTADDLFGLKTSCYFIDCDLPVVWLAIGAEGANSFASLSALSGDVRSSRGGGTHPIELPAGADLDPTPNGASQPLTVPPTTMAVAPTMAPTPSATAPAPPTSVPLVGASPYYPGTTNPRPAPAGNGHGPHGSCDGSESTPPCGPGAVVGEYYPYTLVVDCTGAEWFNGRAWAQGLVPNTPPGQVSYEHVWMLLSGADQAGWVGPGAVGMAPVSGSSPTCAADASTTVAPSRRHPAASSS